MGGRVQCSDLPQELWTMIGKHVNDHTDILRFRSVCKSLQNDCWMKSGVNGLR
jgi:hypothetical protein